MGRFNANRQGRGRGGRGNGNTSSGGRGSGKLQSNNNNNRSTKKTENINDFVFQPLQLGKQQASNTYETVKEFVVKHIQRTFLNGQDIAECLRQEVMVALPSPVRGVSTKSVQEEKHFEQKSYDIIFQSQCQVYAERQLTLQQNAPKAFALIMTQFCTKTMQQRSKTIRTTTQPTST